MIIDSPLDLIFRDLFYRLPAFAGAHDVFLKLEGFNVTGSIKVKTAIGLVDDLERRGVARPGRNRARRIVVGKSRHRLEPRMRRQGLRVHLRDRSQCQPRQHQGHGALRREGHRREGARPSRRLSRQPTQENRPDRGQRPERGLAQPIRQHSQQERPCRADRERDRPPVSQGRLDVRRLRHDGHPGRRLRAASPGISRASKSWPSSPPAPLLLAASPENATSRESAPACGRSLPISPIRTGLSSIGEEKTVASAWLSFAIITCSSAAAPERSLPQFRQLAQEFAPDDTVVAISPDLGDKYLDTIYDPNWVESVITESKPQSINQGE